MFARIYCFWENGRGATEEKIITFIKVFKITRRERKNYKVVRSLFCLLVTRLRKIPDTSSTIRTGTLVNIRRLFGEKSVDGYRRL